MHNSEYREAYPNESSIIAFINGMRYMDAYKSLKTCRDVMKMIWENRHSLSPETYRATRNIMLREVKAHRNRMFWFSSPHSD